MRTIWAIGALTAGSVLLAPGAARAAVATSQEYQVSVDTSSVAGLSGWFMFQAGIPAGVDTPYTNVAEVSNLQPGGTGITEEQDTAIGVSVKSHSEFDLTVTQASPDAQYIYDTTAYGNTMTFDVTLSGADLLGQNPDTWGIPYFALYMYANVPGDGTVGVLADNDPYFDTVGVTVDNNGNLVTDNSTEGSITAVPVPEPASLAAFAMTGAALVVRRRR